MVIGTGKITFRLVSCHSLKEKRSVVKAIIRRTRNHFNISMAEVDSHDSHHRTEIGFSIVGNDPRVINAKSDKILNFIDNLELAEIIHTDMEIIHI